MAKLHYYYSTMKSGKSLEIYKIYDNYKRQGKNALAFVHEIAGEIESRLGFEVPAHVINNESNLFEIVCNSLFNEFEFQDIHCVLVDEVNFLTKEHVIQMSDITDRLNIPVIGTGLKNRFDNELFEGSKYMLIYADDIQEIKTVCEFCNKKATMVLRLVDDKPVFEGEPILTKDECDYISVCRKCWKSPPLGNPLMQEFIKKESE